MTEVFGWIGWLIWSLLALLWSIVWLLLGGWVSTAAQVIAVLMAIFVYRYGWQRAPSELSRQAVAVWRFSTGALRASEALSQADMDRRRQLEVEAARGKHRRRGARHAGDVTINLSALLSVTMLVALWLLSLV